MSKSNPSGARFWIVAVITLLIAAAGLAALYPLMTPLAHNESARLTAQAQADRGVTAADYQLAVWLNQGNQTARLGLAAIQIDSGQASLALVTLRSAGQGSAAEALRVRALIEDNQPGAAAAAAGGLVDLAPTDANIELAALADAAAGRPLAPTSSLIAHLTSPEAVQAIARVNAGQLPLAAELYATGLLRSSRSILLTLPQSYERNLLLATDDYDIHSQATLDQAANLLTASISLSPADITNRQLLVQVYRARGDLAQASTQDAVIAKLQSGRP